MITILIILGIAVLVGLIAWWIDGRGKVGIAFGALTGLVITLVWLALDAFAF